MKTLIGVVSWALLTAVAAAQAPQGPADQVDRVFADFNKPNSPGCSVGVARNGQFVFRRSYGEGSLELGVPLTSQSVFYLASVSKQFTAASLVLAAEQGYLSLDDDVRKYIPELPNYGYRVTLRQMLQHTAGFRDFFSLLYLAGNDLAVMPSSHEILALIVRQKALNNVPGDEFIYSNSNYFLLGVVLQRATHKSLAQFAAENIFQPLEMNHTRFYDDHTLVVPDRVAAYYPGKNGGFLVGWSTTFDLVGSGGVMSSVDDLLLWDNNFYANKLGKGTLLEELQTRAVLNNGNRISYALGLDLDQYRGLPTVEHNGGTFGYRTTLLRFPNQRFSVITLCNVANANPESLSRRIADVYLAGELQPEPVPAAGLPDPSLFAGTYIDARTHFTYKFTAANGNLMGWGAVLKRIDRNHYHDLGDNVITFGTVNDRMHCSLDIPGERLFSGDKIDELHLPVASLQRFAGTYHSDEIGATYAFLVEGGELMLHNRERPAVKLIPFGPDEFDAEPVGSIIFRQDASGAISGLSVFNQNARGIQFGKTRP